MKTDMEQRASELGRYIVESGNTVRAAAAVFDISKSTVYTDVTFRLEKTDPPLARRVKAVLEKNKAERHVRGGESTRQKFIRLKNPDT